MEFVQQNSQAQIGLTALSSVDRSDEKVYRSTTIPINNNRGELLKNDRSQPNHNWDGNGENGVHRLPQFSNLPSREPIDLQFKDVVYTVNMGFRKGRKEILHRVNGKFPGTQLTAIMGPSGAGKSTLLDVLSGYRKTGVTGSVYVNGRIRNLETFRKMSCYITQDDRLQPLLTVLENMQIAADFKLGNQLKSHEKAERIEEILTVLGLYEHQMTLSGRLSGGQKKRLSIALELISNPTVMFLDEPTTGLDSHSCTQVVNLLRFLASQGRTIICTIHQPSAKLFQEFEQVYVLAQGECLYQGSANKIVPYLQSVELPCPKYHNPADYIIELACGEYGNDKISLMVQSMENGECIKWLNDPSSIMKLEDLRKKFPLSTNSKENNALEATSAFNQLRILMRRGFLKTSRDTTLTHLRIGVNVFVALMLGCLFIKAGNEGSRVLDNYNLLFAILIHQGMTTMMLTVLTFPMELSILLKEHFNRWYSLKMYYASVTLLGIPISVVCCIIFTVLIYLLSGQPLELSRFAMFFAISLLLDFVGQTMGLCVGAWFDVVNGTFLAPTLSIPMMMFAGFGVTLRDIPSYLKWGTYISYMRYGLEGYVGAIYGEDRENLACDEAAYCHYRYPKKFLSEITMRGDQFWYDLVALIIIFLVFRLAAYLVLRWKVISVR